MNDPVNPPSMQTPTTANLCQTMPTSVTDILIACYQKMNPTFTTATQNADDKAAQQAYRVCYGWIKNHIEEKLNRR